MFLTSKGSEIDQVLKEYGKSQENLIPILQDVQQKLSFLAPEAIQRVSSYRGLSENEVYGVATFYAQFRFQPPGVHQIKVCRGTACHVRGSGLILEAIGRKLGIDTGETSRDGEFSLERVACFGSCALAPVLVVDEKVYGRMTSRQAEKLIKGSK
jgi:NADH-quinone oxidoreductase subunit E